MHTRSIAGCYTCKARKKKCDEARPKCQRCIRGGFECGGYAPLNNPDGKGVMRRSKAPPSVSESSQLPTRSSEVTSFSHSSGLAHARQAGSQGSSLIEESVDSIATDRSGDPRYSPGIHSTGPPVPIRQDAQLHLASSPWAEPGVSAFSLVNSVVNGPPTILYPRFNKHIAPSPSCSSGGSSSTISSSSRSPSDISLHYSSNVPPTIPPVFTSSRQATPIQALFSPSESETDLPEYSLRDPNDQISRIAYGPIWPSPYPCVKAKVEQPNTDDEDDPEGVSRALCRAVTPDPNTRDNSLPFVLQSYARWVNFVVFDPLRVIHLMRENIIAQFSSCQESRTRVILMSNVLGSLSKSPELNPKSLSTVALLRIEACRALEQYRSTRFNGQRGVDVREALQVLGQMSEIIIVQRYTGRFSNVTQLMQDAAPVFRQACPEPPGQLVNLPKLLLHPDLNLRSFAATDVIVSITKARPMLFKYDVTHTPEMAEQMANGELGLQWLHGVPDQVIVLLARINVLYEDFGTNIDPRCISDIEEQTRNIKVRPPSASADPFATVWRLMVHECWRQTVYIYLYMVLCGAQANDPRVLKAVRAFTRLVDGVRSGRNPDAFLFIPIMVAGASAYEGWDRDILLQRMLGLQECTTPNTAGHESLMILLDIWERTKAENRPAVWQDLIIASLKIAG